MILNCISVSSQVFKVTPKGLINNKGGNSTTIIADNKTSKDLYEDALIYINETYQYPEEAIEGNVENKYIRFRTFIENFTTVKNGGVRISIDAEYSIALKFNEGEVEIFIEDLDLGGLTWKGSVWKGYPIWNKKGKLRMPETKLFIETYFNNQIDVLSEIFNK